MQRIFLFLISSDELYDVDYQDDGNEVGENSPHEGAYHADNHYHCHEDKDGYEPAGHAYLMDGPAPLRVKVSSLKESWGPVPDAPLNCVSLASWA